MTSQSNLFIWLFLNYHSQITWKCYKSIITETQMCHLTQIWPQHTAWSRCCTKTHMLLLLLSGVAPPSFVTFIHCLENSTACSMIKIVKNRSTWSKQGFKAFILFFPQSIILIQESLAQTFHVKTSQICQKVSKQLQLLKMRLVTDVSASNLLKSPSYCTTFSNKIHFLFQYLFSIETAPFSIIQTYCTYIVCC